MQQIAQRFLYIIGTCISCVLTNGSVQAQISPDGTLPTNVNQLGNILEITGGAKAGSNLFHSFKEFSVPNGSEAFFNNINNLNGINNIINRVTGGSVSNIDGLIRENYGANFILINPSGINFGPNARLDIGGSFLASTADSLKFADGTEFSAINAQSTPTLTISVPVGLQFGQNPAPINVQGTGHNLSIEFQIFSPYTRGETAGLEVQPGKTLALVGGDINLDGGTLTAEGGRIELGSVAGGLVSLDADPTNPTWTLGYEGVPGFKDIEMRSQAIADASGVGSGSIQLQARNISMYDGSTVLIQTQGLEPAGNIDIKASESLKLNGTTPDGQVSTNIFAETIGGGKSADITITTPRVIVEDGGVISAFTYTPAPGGRITVNASESVELIGFSPINPNRFSAISASAFSSGNAGDINVSTKQVIATNGGNIASVTAGTGGGGNLTVNATESVELIGVTPGVFTPSQFSVGTGGPGKAGNLTINTGRLVIRDGGRVDASTFASGAAGSITINAQESVEVSGTVPGSLNPSLIISSASILDPPLQQLLRLPPVPSGASGDVTINTGKLIVSNGAQVTAENQGTGDAGSVRIRANSVFLDQKGGITAATTSGEGGNIFINAKTVQMRRGSQISGEAGGTGNGGNITIAGFSPADAVVLLEGSNITANAFEGNGGNISINTLGLFVCPECQISASSQLGLDGVVEIFTPDTENNQEIVDLPQEIAKPEEVVAQVCSAASEQNRSEFIITGRGGLPPRPNDTLSSEALVSFGAASVGVEKKPNSAAIPPPARGWYVNSKGAVILTAQASNTTPYGSGFTSSSCHAN